MLLIEGYLILVLVNNFSSLEDIDGSRILILDVLECLIYHLLLPLSYYFHLIV